MREEEELDRQTQLGCWSLRFLTGMLCPPTVVRPASSLPPPPSCIPQCILLCRQQNSAESGGAPHSCLTYLNLSAGTAELLNKMKEPSELAAASSEEDLAQKKVSFLPPTPQPIAEPESGA